jgi:stage V sporulation protein G
MQDLRDVEGGNANKLYADIAHPINQECRDLIQQSVIGEYALELERAKLPGYKSRYDDEYTENTPVQEPSKNTGNAPRPNMIDRDPSAKQSPSNSPSENQSLDSRDFGNGIF